MPPPTSTVSRKRTRSSNISENNDDTLETSSTSSSTTTTVPPKRRRNNSSSTSRRNYTLRNRIVPVQSPSDVSQTSTDRTNQTQRYNLRPRRSQLSTSNDRTVAQPRQYRFVYISDDDEQPTTNQSTSSSAMNTTLNLITDDEDDTPQTTHRRTARATNHTRTRTNTDPTSSSINDNSDHSTNGTGGHVRLNRAIEIVIDSIQSLEGAVNNFDQFFFSLIYSRLNTRPEVESFEGMIRLSRILNLSFPSRLSQDEIDALPQINFSTKTDSSSSSLLLVEKCPICLTEFTDQEIINKLNCSHLFHLPCISTWLSENDSCPTCRRKVNGD